MADVKRRRLPQLPFDAGTHRRLICAAAHRLFSDQGLPGDLDRRHRRRGWRRPPDDLHGRRPQVDDPAPRRRPSPDRRRRPGPDRTATVVARGDRRARPRALDPAGGPQHVLDQPALRTACCAHSRPPRPWTPTPARCGKRFQQQRHDGLNEFAAALTGKTTRTCVTTRAP